MPVFRQVCSKQMTSQDTCATTVSLRLQDCGPTAVNLKHELTLSHTWASGCSWNLPSAPKSSSAPQDQQPGSCNSLGVRRRENPKPRKSEIHRVPALPACVFHPASPGLGWDKSFRRPSACIRSTLCSRVNRRQSEIRTVASGLSAQ